MTRYGLNPYGKALWRVVWAPTVKKIVGGQFSDGYTGYRVRKAYKQIGDNWILEKWQSAWDHTKMSRQSYESKFGDASGLISTGPYPERGIYYLAEVLNGNPADMNFDWIIGFINKAARNDPQENMRAYLDSMKKQDEADAQNRFDRCKELLPAFGVRATSYRGHVKATKSAPLMKSANELGLPTKGPFVMKENHAV